MARKCAYWEIKFTDVTKNNFLGQHCICCPWRSQFLLWICIISDIVFLYFLCFICFKWNDSFSCLACENIRFSSLFVAEDVLSDEERGETDVFAGYQLLRNAVFKFSLFVPRKCPVHKNINADSYKTVYLKQTMEEYYNIALSNYDCENPRTFKSVCLKCNKCRSLVQPVQF